MSGCRQQKSRLQKNSSQSRLQRNDQVSLRKKKVVPNAREVQRENFVHQRDWKHTKQLQSIDLILIQIKINELNNLKNTYEAMGKSEH